MDSSGFVFPIDNPLKSIELPLEPVEFFFKVPITRAGPAWDDMGTTLTPILRTDRVCAPTCNGRHQINLSGSAWTNPEGRDIQFRSHVDWPGTDSDSEQFGTFSDGTARREPPSA